MNTVKLNRPLPGTVQVLDRFWTPYLDKIRHVTLPYVFEKFEECGYLNNFALVAEGSAADHSVTNGHAGPPFSDGLLLESIRGACDFLAAGYDPALDELLDRMIAVIAAASEKSPDGFLCTPTMLKYPDKRWGENGGDIVHQHDLYDHGALVEAAVSHYRATGKTTLLLPAVRAANLICREIGALPKKNIVPGHSLPEEAFVRLYCLFRDHRELDAFAAEHGVDTAEYLRVAEFWYDGRGQRPGSEKFSREYHQNHAPFAQQRDAVGHAVRATLCYTGAAAIVREAGREDYMPALNALWESITRRKVHISGGIGTRHDIEGFDTDYNLPNDAYLETCAAIGLAFFAGEMSLLTPKSEYFDMFERALCNNVLAAIAEDGLHYFYQNPLVSDGSVRRWSWHGCPCCPPMLLKLYSSLGSYIYTTAADRLYVNLYIGSRLENDRLTISQDDRRVTLDTKGKAMALYLRIPEYARHFALSYDGAPVEYTVENGYAVIRRVWSGETLTVSFDTPPRRVCANPAVEADCGHVAVMRGPWLMCAEGLDNGGNVDFTIAAEPELEAEGDGVIGRTVDGRQFRLIPYYRWCNRENSGSMQVWFRQDAMADTRTITDTMDGRLYMDYDEI